MPQVVAILNNAEHKALAQRAKLERRSLGNQLIAEAEERERIRLENEKLKAEAAAREAQMKAEREKAEA